MSDELIDPAEHMAMVIKHKHGQSKQAMVPIVDAVDVGRVRANLNPPQVQQDEAPLDGYGLYTALISRIPHDTQITFTPEQIGALRQASEQLRWGKHSLDIRLSLPLPGKRFYMVWLAGSERRSHERIAREGTRELTPGKMLVLAAWAAAVWVLVYYATGNVPPIS